LSLLYRYLSTSGRPPSTSHNAISPWTNRKSATNWINHKCQKTKIWCNQIPATTSDGKWHMTDYLNQRLKTFHAAFSMGPCSIIKAKVPETYQASCSTCLPMLLVLEEPAARAAARQWLCWWNSHQLVLQECSELLNHTHVNNLEIIDRVEWRLGDNIIHERSFHQPCNETWLK
jgi:hypothetical protein